MLLPAPEEDLASPERLPEDWAELNPEIILSSLADEKHGKATDPLPPIPPLPDSDDL